MASRGFFVACLALVSGCDGCGKDKPYTPFGVQSGVASAAPTEDGGADEPDAGSEKPKFVAKAATAAPERATRWSLDGREIVAPTGRVFERGLAADFDADGSREIVAWTLPASTSPPAPPGELWLYPAKGASKKLADLPGFVPTGPSCKHVPSLQQTGPRTVTLDVTAVCTTTLLERAPARSLSVVAPLAERPLILTLRAAAPARNEPFALDVDSADRDGDGRDDVRLVVTQKPVCRVAPSPGSNECPTDKDDKNASAQVIWIDRAAGPSRDASEPSASLGALAAAELGRSKRKQSTAQVPRGVAQARRLMGTLCAEGGTARVLEADGSMLRCAPLGTLVERLLVAEVQASLTDKDPSRALFALERDGWYFGKVADKRRAELEKSILAEAVALEPKESSPNVQVAARAKPRLSPLSFEATGELLVQTSSGLMRVTESGTSEAVDADSGVVAWPLGVTTKSGRRLDNVVFPCDRSDVYPLVVESSGSFVPAPPSPLLAPRPGVCSGGRPPSVAPTLLGEKDDSPALVVAGESLGPRITRAEAVLRPRVWGSPHSPNGRHSVTPTSLGLWIEGGDKPELWRVKGAASLSECTVSDGAKAVACIAGTQVKLFQR